MVIPQQAWFFNVFKSWCDKNLKGSDVNTIVGDFNIDMSNDTTYSTSLHNVIAAYQRKIVLGTGTYAGHKYRSNLMQCNWEEVSKF